MHLVPVIEVEIFSQVAPSAKGRADFLRRPVINGDGGFVIPAGLRLRVEDRRSDAWRPSLSCFATATTTTRSLYLRKLGMRGDLILN